MNPTLLLEDSDGAERLVKSRLSSFASSFTKMAGSSAASLHTTGKIAFTKLSRFALEAELLSKEDREGGEDGRRNDS